MSTTDRVRDSVTASIKSAEEFIESTKESLQRELSKTAPNIQHDLDRSLEEAGRALSNAFSSIEKKTNREQVDLLNAYKSFLQKQIAFVDERLKTIRKS
jgi:F0F1-type ATP synthase membrane subunit b/b'